MKREILINAAARETRIAILEDDRLVELLVDRPDTRRMIGDIYLGKVEAVLPGIQAAFVNIGTEKSAFLHASDVQAVDLDDDSDPDDHDDDDAEPTNGNGTNGHAGGGSGRRGGGGKIPPIQDSLKRGQDILVQVTKEPISTKGPRVTAQISLAGRFLVYIPDGGTKVGVSRKIGAGAERQRLKEMVRGFLPEKSGGVIVRTVSEDVTPDMLKRELESLIAQWRRIKKKTRFVHAPAVIHRETGLTRGLVRDLFSAKVDSLTVDSKQVFNEIVEYLEDIAPDLIPRVKLHSEEPPLFDKFEIESEIRDIFKRRCDLPSGGYLIIEPTDGRSQRRLKMSRISDSISNLSKSGGSSECSFTRGIKSGAISSRYSTISLNTCLESTVSESTLALNRSRTRPRVRPVSR